MPNKSDWWDNNRYPNTRQFKSCFNARYKEIEWARKTMLDPNNHFNENDFKEYTKMLYENGMVYLSERAYQHLLSKGCTIFAYKTPYIENVSLNMLWNGYQPINYLQSKVHRLGGLIWEHVVPANVIINQYLHNSQHTYQDYLNCLNYGMVCIITQDEDKQLAKRFKNHMPKGWNWGDCAWDRYSQVNIQTSPISNIQHP